MRVWQEGIYACMFYLKPEELRRMLDFDRLQESADVMIGTARQISIGEPNRYQYDNLTVVLYCHL